MGGVWGFYSETGIVYRPLEFSGRRLVICAHQCVCVKSGALVASGIILSL